MTSINKLSREFAHASVVIGADGELAKVVSLLEANLTLLAEMKALRVQAGELAVEWSGEAATLYADMAYFQDQYLLDFTLAVEEYKRALTEIVDMVGDIPSASVLARVRNL